MFQRLKGVVGSALALSVLVSLVLYNLDLVTAEAAQSQREVHLHPVSRFEPLVVTKVILGAVPVQSGRFTKPRIEAPDPITPFRADDDWIQNLTVLLLNRTNKTIIFAHITLGFSETANGPPRSMFHLNLGVVPPSLSFNLDGRPFPQQLGSEPISFPPHQTMALHLGDHSDQIKATVERAMPLAAVNMLAITVGPPIFFADGMQLNGGYRVLDPKTNTWRPMDPDYFPGDFDAYWPGRPGWVDPR